ncbi:MAG: 1,2-phenylacetyl-CoA epoxidase subunit PaaC [Flavipsychrobacter sp.]
MNTDNSLLAYTLGLADNALIIGHRLSEWCGHGPILEQDIALTNTSLDHLGQARSLYQYAAEQVNALPADAEQKLFSSEALQVNIAAGNAIDEDDLAYLRDAWDFKNVLLAEQPNKDWAYTVARAFYFDVFQYFLFRELMNSSDVTLAAIAEKSVKETEYHKRWSSEWVIRLGDGTEESHVRMQTAINDLWPYTGELFKMNKAEAAMLATGAGADLGSVKLLWHKEIAAVLEQATMDMPAQSWMHEGGKEGIHSEHLGYILAELQFMQRAYPNHEW